MNKLLGIALACSLAPLVSVAAEPLALDDAWVRALPPGQPNTAAYLTVTNHGAATVRIVSASADISDRAEMHTTREIDGYQRMEQLTELQLAPGQSLVFAPGGTHLMLMGLKRMPAAGEQVRLCLQVAAGNEVCTSADVRKSGGGGAPSHEHHQH